MTLRMKLNSTKHIWLPAILTVYAVIMAFLGRDIWLVQGDYIRFFGTIIGEAVIIVALSYFLRRKYKLKQRLEMMLPPDTSPDSNVDDKSYSPPGQ